MHKCAYIDSRNGSALALSDDRVDADAKRCSSCDLNVCTLMMMMFIATLEPGLALHSVEDGGVAQVNPFGALCTWLAHG